MDQREEMEYTRKLTNMRMYVPFLEKTISKLEKARDPSKESQLVKMKSMLNILTDDSGKKLRMDTLEKCKDVLEKLHEKVEGFPLEMKQTSSTAHSSISPNVSRFNQHRENNSRQRPKFDQHMEENINHRSRFDWRDQDSTNHRSKFGPQRDDNAIATATANSRSRFDHHRDDNVSARSRFDHRDDNSNARSRFDQRDDSANARLRFDQRDDNSGPRSRFGHQREENINQRPRFDQREESHRSRWPHKGPKANQNSNPRLEDDYEGMERHQGGSRRWNQQTPSSNNSTNPYPSHQQPHMWGSKGPRSNLEQNWRNPAPPNRPPFDRGFQRPPFDENRSQRMPFQGNRPPFQGNMPNFEGARPSGFNSGRFPFEGHNRYDMPRPPMNENRRSGLNTGPGLLGNAPTEFDQRNNANFHRGFANQGDGGRQNPFFRNQQSRFSDPQESRFQDNHMEEQQFHHNDREFRDSSRGKVNWHSQHRRHRNSQEFDQDNFDNFSDTSRNVQNPPTENIGNFDRNRTSRFGENSRPDLEKPNSIQSRWNRSSLQGEVEAGRRSRWDNLSQSNKSWEANISSEKEKSRIDRESKSLAEQSDHEKGQSGPKANLASLESPMSPPAGAIDTPQSPEENTPQSPPPAALPQVSEGVVRVPKVIPLEKNSQVIPLDKTPQVIPLEKPKQIPLERKSPSAVKVIPESSLSPNAKPTKESFSSPPTSPPVESSDIRLPKPIPTSRQAERNIFSLPKPVTSQQQPTFQPRPLLPRPGAGSDIQNLSQFQQPRYPQPPVRPLAWSQPFRPNKKPATYGEYRKMKEEHDRKMREEEKRIEEFRRRFEIPAEEPAESKSDSEDNDRVSEQLPANKEEPGSISNFKIPRKKRTSVDSDKDLRSPPALVIASPPPSSLSPTASRKESESDSEPELKIVDPDLGSDRESEDSTPRLSIDEPKESAASNTEQPEDKKTKELLKTIVASLKPEEATKLLRKASILEKEEKLSLKQLKYLLANDSDSDEDPEPVEKPEEKPEPKGSSKKTKKGKGKPTGVTSRTPPKTVKPRASPSTGMRRSKRLNVPDAEVVSSVMAEEEDLNDNLVIDEGEGPSHAADDEVIKAADLTDQSASPKLPPIRKPRGRPRKIRGKPDNIQDDSVSSSNLDDSESTDSVPDKPASLTQVQSNIKSETKDTGIILKPRSGRMMGKMAPKSKTWFPDRGDNKKERKSVFGSSEKSVVTIKKEPKEADLKVFIGSEDLTLENKFHTKDAHITQELKDGLKSRLLNLNSIMEKFNKREEKSEESTDAKPTEKIDCDKKHIEFEDVGPCILTEEPQSYSLNIKSTIDKLKMEVNDIPLEKEDKKRDVEDVNFLSLVKEISFNTAKSNKKEHKEAEKICLDIYTRHKITQNPSAPLKPGFEGSFVEYYKDKVGDIFKCYAANCSQGCNDPNVFTIHLREHAQTDESTWKRCVYCNKNFSSPESLVLHVIAVHGSCCYQCPYCFHRTGSQIGMLVHQQCLHSEEKPGYINCQALSLEMNQFEPSRIPLLKCKTCNIQMENYDAFASHLKSHYNLEDFTELVCWHCGSCFNEISALILHSCLMHTSEKMVCGVRHIDMYEKNMATLTQNSFSDHDWDMFSSSDLEDETGGGESGEEFGDKNGLTGKNLYRCGNGECQYSVENVSTFRDHLSVCEYSVDQTYLTCFHCSKQLKHVPTLLDHLKSHGPMRYSCSLCPYRSALPATTKNHLKSVHKVLQAKVVPIDPLKTNTELHNFLVLPKNAIPRGILITSGSKQKDTFTPEEIDSIPPVSMVRNAIRCSVCDFSTKVRNNLVKHLKLHAKIEKTKADEVKDNAKVVIPPLTPINPPTHEFEQKGGKMSSLIDADNDEERAKKPMTQEEMDRLPPIIAENTRFSCCEKDCLYITIDDVMLLYHIQALHPNLSRYTCPHCPAGVSVEFEDLEFHMRCHGDLLFKCLHCDYYHWQKRTAEKHVAESHPNRKQFVRNVRIEAEMRAKMVPEEVPISKKPAKLGEGHLVPVYKPYKCGLCDHAEEKLEAMKSHCSNVHEICQQFKCSLCTYSSDSKTEIENHLSAQHPNASLSMIRIFFIDSSTTSSQGNSDPVFEERHEPLWRRDMPGLKHIRGILYDDDEMPSEAPIPAPVSKKRATPSSQNASHTESKNITDEADNFPMKCRECGIMKKTIKGLKMHIKLLHLRTGKFRCVRCQFSANILSSINTHYKIKHPNHEPNFEERSDESMTFTHEYWKNDWGIPTLQERKEFALGSNFTKSESPPHKKAKKVKKRGPAKKKKEDCEILTKSTSGKDVEEIPSIAEDHAEVKALPLELAAAAPHHPEVVLDKKTIERIMEISPFENVSTYKCQFCPKRSQKLERIERHLKSDHPQRSLGSGEKNYKILSRDQVVDMLTLVMDSADYICFYCDDVVGSIRQLKNHFDSAHASESFKVKSFQGKGVGGYLECQLCGHLTPGLERSKQKVHFHEEHPLESSVNASKYVLKTKPTNETLSGSNMKVDFTRFNGMTMNCPKEDCNFEAKSLSAMNNHLRRHTQTFKCGHCGKTHTSSSDFHQHSAMMHGDKIPDLIKDPEAEAEFDALKGLFEDSLTKRLETDKGSTSGKKRKPPGLSTARKSTKHRKVNTARKSTGGRLNSGHSQDEYSFYGMPYQEADFSQISTKMSMGGMELTLNGEKMAEIVNLKPKVFVKDIKK